MPYRVKEAAATPSSKQSEGRGEFEFAILAILRYNNYVSFLRKLVFLYEEIY